MNANLAYLLLRVTLGLNILIHGLVRLVSGTSNFVEGTSTQFSKTFLPEWSVSLFLNQLPYLETAIGFLILIGLWTRVSLLVGSTLMLSLIFGMSLVQKWDIVGIQMIYIIFYYLLIQRLEDNKFSIDNCFSKNNM